jgi:subtilisin family serine protease
MRFLILMTALGAAAAAEAQIRLPVQLPSLPLPSLQQNLSVPEQALSDVRRQASALLIRNNRRLIEADPDGEPIVRGEVLAVSIDDAMVSRWVARGFSVERAETIPAANLRVIVLKVPEKLSTRQALRELRDADTQGVYDYNHIYLGSGRAAGVDAADTDTDAGAADAAAAVPSVEPPQSRMRVGLLDSGLDDTHPAFRASVIHPWGCAGKRVPSAHGTAVGSLLVAHVGGELYAADVYCGEPTGGAVDIIVAALGWMAEEQVAVINVSLVGPKNVLLERIVGALIARGHLIVAAVGNDGPAAPPLYPAAYPDVVGVTAVDAHRRVLVEAERGPQVMFAARGADLKAAALNHGYVSVRGTSFAAPAVAALLARTVLTPDRKTSIGAIDALAKQAVDLGAPGKDLTYGFGLVGWDTP